MGGGAKKGGLAFLSKKQWHTSTRKNIERVLLAEQNERKRIEEEEKTRTEIKDRRRIEELRRLQEKAGLITNSYAPEINWIYSGGITDTNDNTTFDITKKPIKDEKQEEKYLLGQEIKQFTNPNLDKQKSNKDINKPREEFTSRVEMLALIRDDPLTSMLLEEKKLRDDIIRNPLKMEKLRKLATKITNDKKVHDTVDDTKSSKNMYDISYKVEGDGDTNKYIKKEIISDSKYKDEYLYDNNKSYKDKYNNNKGYKDEYNRDEYNSNDKNTYYSNRDKYRDDYHYSRDKYKNNHHYNRDKYKDDYHYNRDKYNDKTYRYSDKYKYKDNDTIPQYNDTKSSYKNRDRYNRDDYRDHKNQYLSERDIKSEYKELEANRSRSPTTVGSRDIIKYKEDTKTMLKNNKDIKQRETSHNAEFEVSSSDIDDITIKKKNQPVLVGYVKQNNTKCITKTNDEQIDTQKKLQQMIEDGQKRTEDTKRLQQDHEKSTKLEEEKYHRNMKNNQQPRFIADMNREVINEQALGRTAANYR